MARTGPKSAFTADDKARIADLISRGFTQSEIASVLGTTQQTISRLARTIATETEVRESATWESAVADSEAFMATFPSKLKALRAVGQLYVAYGITHCADHPHDPGNGLPLDGHRKRCDGMWKTHLEQREAVFAAYHAHDWASND